MSGGARDARTLAGRHAIVTGASRGIGLAIATELARRGASVTLMARSADALQAQASELAAAHGVATRAVPCDVADAASVRGAFRMTAFRFARDQDLDRKDKRRAGDLHLPPGAHQRPGINRVFVPRTLYSVPRTRPQSRIASGSSPAPFAHAS